MIYRYTIGTPFETEAVLNENKQSVEHFVVAHPTNKPILLSVPENNTCGYFTATNAFTYTCSLSADSIVYGLGQANRGINKRGFQYVNMCADDPHHTEDMLSFYGAHNFVIVDGEACFGLFFDCPGKITFDIGYTSLDQMTITAEHPELTLYLITGDSSYEVTKQFRQLIGRSYIPPKFAFGYGQSRWGYQCEADIEEVLNGYRANHIPLDMIYMDIDYMERYKDFTVHQDRFPNLTAFATKMKKNHIHLVPIIDAAVKVEKGYDIYEEGAARDYFCKREDGTDFVGAVWPGPSVFPDVLNAEARTWFGSHYKRLTDCGIDAFWNDMCEPAIFYSLEGVNEYKDYLINDLLKKEDFPYFEPENRAAALQNNLEDYKRFYHNVNGTPIRHDKLHNLYGMNMTRAAFEGCQAAVPNQRTLLFSRSSYIGAHRYGGIWTGDNQSWWSHILLNLKMMPSLNMCGFLYCGADLGGFGSDTTEDLLLRWLALGVFTPLMRNHSCAGTRRQECYQFSNPEAFRHVVGVRYRLLPYLYSEFMKAALNNDLYLRPLAFDYPKDPIARHTEDQLFLGKEVMIAPVYTQNALGRYVYLPEEMLFCKFLPDGSISQTILSAGHHFVEIALDEVPLFIRKNCCIPVVDSAEYVDAIDMSTLQYLGYPDASYDLYNDDGITPL